MRHFTNIAATRLPARSGPANGRATLQSLKLIRVLTALFCFALLLTPTIAGADTICFLRVFKLNDSGHSEAQNYVINTETDWQTLWDKIFSNQSEKPPLPEIDFSRRTIVAVFQGEQPTGGYEISIEEIVGTENSVEVAVKAFSPGPRCTVTGTVTRPLDIVEIEKTEKQIVFRVKHKVRNFCG
jgi:hypothetical protein